MNVYGRLPKSLKDIVDEFKPPGLVAHKALMKGVVKDLKTVYKNSPYDDFDNVNMIYALSFRGYHVKSIQVGLSVVNGDIQHKFARITPRDMRKSLQNIETRDRLPHLMRDADPTRF